MHLCPAYNRRLMSHTAYAPLPGANYVAFSCCHIIANEYCLSILFALLPYVVREEVLFGTHACDRRKNFMDMRGYCGRRNCTRGRQKRHTCGLYFEPLAAPAFDEEATRQEGCNAFNPANREKGKNILPPRKSP